MRTLPLPGRKYLRSILDYDPETGVFRWKVRRSRRVLAGQKAGHINGGYYRIVIDGKKYQAHRLAWAWMYGAGDIPNGFFVDHINGCGIDNRKANLRLATHSQNSANCKARDGRLKGAYRNSDCIKQWRAALRVGGELVYLGRFDTEEEAHAAYCAAAEKYHGEFHRAS